MLKDFEGFSIWSEDYKKLAKWYQDTFGLEVAYELNLSNDMAIGLKINPKSEQYLWIGYHNKVKGKNKDMYRLMISYWVDDVYQAAKELKAKGVKFIAEPQAAPSGDGLHVATAVDPEDNIIQLYSMEGKTF